MTLAPRWRKVLRDVIGNPARTSLVVVSIAVGVVAVGMVTGAYMVIATDLPGGYRQINPAHARLSTAPFDEELVQSVRRIPQVEDAVGARQVAVQARLDGGRWQELVLVVIEDFEDQRINMVQPESGEWPPSRMGVVVERTSPEVLETGVGQELTIKLGNDDMRSLQVVGLAHDMNEMAANFTGTAFGYVSFDTLEKLGYDRDFNQLLIRVTGDASTREHNEVVAQAVSDKVEKAGVSVYRTFVPEPGKHEMEQFLTPMLLILGAMGIMSLLLSGFLVVNIISALLAQQTRQIGVMKTLGARSGDVSRMYLVTVLVFGLLALLLAIPLGAAATIWVTQYVSQLLNFNAVSSPLPPVVLLLEVVVALAVPVLAALVPILRGSRVTVREAITDYGVSAGGFGNGFIDTVLEQVHFLSRPLLISLRNTFRRKGRLILTLTTLTLASAVFISVLSVRSSLNSTMDDAFDYWEYEVHLDFDRTYRADYLEQLALEFPGVAAAEAWGSRNVTRIRADDSESDSIRMIAPPPDSKMLQPTLLEGRWLVEEDENAVVMNTDLLDDEPDLQVGDTIVLDVADKEVEWTIVGLVRSVMAGPFVYANFPYFSEVTRNTNVANSLNIALDDRSRQSQIAMTSSLEQYFEDSGVRVSAAESTVARTERVASQYGVLVMFLAVMALTLAIVGGLGLMGSMSINVLERRREIGVMRSIGASSSAIMQIVIVEGVIIGVISWTVGALLAFPLGKVLSDAVGAGFIHSDLTYTYSFLGAAMWLAVVIGIAAFASFMPAKSASSLAVREVLAYE